MSNNLGGLRAALSIKKTTKTCPRCGSKVQRNGECKGCGLYIPPDDASKTSGPERVR